MASTRGTHRHPGRLVSHHELLEQAWGSAYVQQIQDLRVYLGQLRRKLDEASWVWFRSFD